MRLCRRVEAGGLLSKPLRAAVFRRASGLCECGCQRYIDEESGRLDHYFGRAKVKESPETCWAISIPCDEDKTASRPNAEVWLQRFIAHCRRHGYAAEEELAKSKLFRLWHKRWPWLEHKESI